MSEETNGRQSSDPMEVWEQWYDSVSRGFSKATSESGGKQAYPDPSDLYRTWSKGVTGAQEQFKHSSAHPQQLWQQWFEASAETWRKAAEAGGDPLGLTTQWLKMMEEARAKMFAGVDLPVDPFSLFKQWYDATNEKLSTMIGGIIGTEQFMQISREFLNSYASFHGTLRRANEEYFRNLQLPTRTDIARVAELVVNLEDKVDQIDSVLGDFVDSDARLALNKSVESLHGRVEGLAKRLDGMESKLDTLLAAFEKLEARGLAAPVEPAKTARSRTHKPDTAHQQASATKAQVGS